MIHAMLPGFSPEKPRFPQDHDFSSLTYEIRDKSSPLRHYFDSLVVDLRGVQRDYRIAAGKMLVGWSGVSAGTLGAAFDFSVRFRLDPAYDAGLAAIAFSDKPAVLAAVHEVVRVAQSSAHARRWGELHSACWALALFTEVYRVGLVEGSPLGAFLAQGEVDVEGLLAAAPSHALSEMADLHALAETRLLPNLEHPISLGPTFAGSAHCNADADVIAAGCLVDLKTRLEQWVPGKPH